MTADYVLNALQWQGDSDVLHRSQKGTGLTVITVNPRGRINPYKANQKGESDPELCRLPEHVALVESGLAEIVILPEAHIDEAAARNVRTYLQGNDEVFAHTAPTSHGRMGAGDCSRWPSRPSASSRCSLLRLKVRLSLEKLE